MSKRWGLVIDQERCIGCEACTVACRIENQAGASWIRVETQNVARKDIPEGRFPDLRMHFRPLLCNHCQNPPCVEACPSDALVKREDGPVVLDQGKCDGCRACSAACPYEAIRFPGEEAPGEKCNLCTHRIDQGLEPFCVVCCEGQAIHFGDLADPAGPLGRLISDKGARVLRPEDGTGPSVHYCPPQKPRRV